MAAIQIDDEPRVTLVVPVRNESESIDALLDSIAAQSRRPDEVVIVDGNSDDDTASRVRARQHDFPIQLTLVDGKGPLLPGAGRNLGVEAARHPWIAFTDAGIVLDEKWLAELVAAAKSHPAASVVYGNYEPRTPDRFARCASVAYVPPPSETPEGLCRRPFIASSLVRREAFLRVGGFPGALRSGEDLLFMRNLTAAGVEAVRAPRAMVHWSMARGVAATFRRFRTYARHNLLAGLAREWQRPVLLRYAAIAGASVLWPPALPSGIALLLLLRAWQALRKNPDADASLFGVALILGVIDAAMFVGSIEWLIRDRRTLA